MSKALAEDAVRGSSDAFDAMVGGVKYNESYRSLMTGNRQPNDILLHSQDVQVKHDKSWMVIKTIPMNYSGVHPITHINVEDLWRDGTNGYVKMMSGGVAYNYVNLEFKTVPFRGMHFRVYIWGKRS